MNNARVLSLLSLAAVLPLSSGCLPVLVGGLFYQEAEQREDRQQFMDGVRKTNLEREKNGLEPLDLCSEKYQFDRAWAMKDPNCRARIKRYEAGDASSLDSHASEERAEADEESGGDDDDGE